MKKTFANIHNGLAWIIFVGSAIQFFLISMVFFGAAPAEVHGIVGFGISILALLMLISAIVVRSDRWNIIVSVIVFLLLFPVQGILAYSEELPAFVRALHGLNGVIILSLAYLLANGPFRATAPA